MEGGHGFELRRFDPTASTHNDSALGLTLKCCLKCYLELVEIPHGVWPMKYEVQVALFLLVGSELNAFCLLSFSKVLFLPF